MSTVAIVPLQRLSEAKSRLAQRLAPAERQELALRLLRHVVTTLQAARSVDYVVVVSPDPAVLAQARSYGVIGLLQTGSGLNPAIELGRAEAIRLGAETLLVVLGDLPLLTPSAVDEFLRQAVGPVTIAPDRHGQGTNALVLRPPSAIAPAFGVSSFHAHRRAAAKRGLQVGEYQSLEIGFDVDTGADLDDLMQVAEDSMCWSALTGKRGVSTGGWE